MQTLEQWDWNAGFAAGSGGLGCHAHLVAAACLREASEIGLSKEELGAIVWQHRTSMERSGLPPASKEGQLDLLFLRVVRSLDALMGSNPELMKHWMEQPNHHLGEVDWLFWTAPIANLRGGVSPLIGALSNEQALQPQTLQVAKVADPPGQAGTVQVHAMMNQMLFDTTFPKFM